MKTEFYNSIILFIFEKCLNIMPILPILEGLDVNILMKSKQTIFCKYLFIYWFINLFVKMIVFILYTCK